MGKDLEKQARDIDDMQEKLHIAVSKGLEWARRDLAVLRRSELEDNHRPLSLESDGKQLHISRTPLTLVETVQFPSHWDMERVEKEVVECARSWVIASARMSEELLFTVKSDGARLAVGFASDIVNSSEEAESSVEARLRASFPGVSFAPIADAKANTAEKLLADFKAARIMTGIPAVLHNDTRQIYSIDRLVRGMRGRPFAIVLSTRRKSRKEVEALLEKRFSQRSENWERIRKEITEQIGEESAKTLGISLGAMGGVMSAAAKSVTESITKALTRGLSVGGMAAVSICTAPGGVGMVKTFGPNVGLNHANTISNSTANTTTNTSGQMWGGQIGPNYSITRSKSRSLASSHEGLNAYAEAYDELLQDHVERLKIALNEGAWDCAAYVFGETPADAQLACALWAREMVGNFEPVEAIRDFEVISNNPVAKSVSLPKDTGKHMAYSTLLTSSEVAAFLNLPTESQPGIEVRRVPRFAVNFPRFGKGNSIDLGTVLDRDVPLPGIAFEFPTDNLSSHALVAGITGSGKTTTVQNLLRQLREVPFVIIEPAKAEYRGLVGEFKELQVFTVGDEQVAPFRLNPFELSEDGNLLSHIDALAAIINAAFPMEGPMSSLVEQALLAVYEQKGWNVDSGLHPAVDRGQEVHSAIPSMSEFYRTLKELVGEQGYAGDYGANIRAALLTRIRSLCIGPRGKIFNTKRSISINSLVSRPAVIELKNLGSDETRSFMMGLLLHRLYKHFEHASRQAQNHGLLGCLLVVEEAHRLFKRTTGKSDTLFGNNTRFHSVELFENIMAEARAFGLGMVIVDQLPLRLSEGAIKNTSTKIVHRLSAIEDAAEMGGSMGLDEDESTFITRLRQGQVLVHRSDMERPAHVVIPPPDDRACGFVSDNELTDLAQERGYSLRRTLSAEADAFLKMVLTKEAQWFVLLGDAVVLSLLVGRLEEDDLNNLIGRAEDRVFDWGNNHQLALNENDASEILRTACREKIAGTWYLKDKPVKLDEVLDLWMRVVASTGTARKFCVDPDSVLALRKALAEAASGAVSLPPSLATGNWERVRSFLPDSRPWASIIAADVASKSPKTESACLDLLEHTVINRVKNKLIVKNGERIVDFAMALFVQAAEILMKHPVELEFLVKSSKAFRSQWHK